MAEVLDQVNIKGSKDGIIIFFPDNGEWKDLISQLLQKFSETKDFFNGASVIINFGTKALQESELNNLCNILKENNVIIKGVLSDSPITKLLVQKHEMPLLSSGSIIHSQSGWQHPVRQNKEAKHVNKNTRRTTKAESQELLASTQSFPGNHLPAIFIKRTLRSGQKINVSGSVIVMGDVNPGAEIVAGGDIIVFGILRGIAHAGAEGNEKAIVAALRLEPTQLRISQYIARAPGNSSSPYKPGEHISGPGRKDSQGSGWDPEIAKVREGKIFIETFQHHDSK